MKLKHMKNRILTLAFTLAATWLAFAQPRAEAAAGAGTAVESDPAYLAIDKAIDLKTLRPEVNVNLPRFLLHDALSELNGGKDDPFAGTGINLADLVKDVKLIRVIVINAGKTNRAALAEGVAKLRDQLESHWTPIATVPKENVGVYAIGDSSGEALAGLAVLVFDGGDAVIANIVGRVSIGKIVKAASHFDKFPKDLLKKLGAAGGEAPEKDGKGEKGHKAEKGDKGEKGPKSEKPATGSAPAPAPEKASS